MKKNLTIDFVSGVSCPWCAVGLASLQQALGRVADAIEVDLTFQPFEINPNMVPEGEDTTEHLAKKYGSTPEQAAAIKDTIRARGAELGFTFNLQEQFYLQQGINSVPAVVTHGRHLVSGGQSPDVFEQALRQIAVG